MTKPIFFLMLLVGGALAAGAGVLTYSEYSRMQAARQAAASSAPAAPGKSELASEAPTATGNAPVAVEESLATPQAPPSKAAPQAPSGSEISGSEVAALPPQAETAAATEEPESPATPPAAADVAWPEASGEAATPDRQPRAARASEPVEPESPGKAAASSEAPPAAEPIRAMEPRQPAAAGEARAAAPAESRAAAEPTAPQQAAEGAPPRPDEIPAGSAEATEPAPAEPAFDIVRVEPTGEAVIAGKAPRRSKVQVLSNGEVVAETSADDAGNWVALPQRPLAPGSHDLTIRALGEAGERADSGQHVAVAVPDAPDEEVVAVLDRPGEASEIVAAPSRETPRPGSEPPQKLEPMATANGVADASGVSAAGAPVLSVDAVEAEGRTMYVAGAGDPGALVRVYVDGDLVGEAEAGAGGRWLVEARRALEEGEVTVRADQLKAGTAQVEARAEVPFVRRLDMAALVPVAQAGGGAGETAQSGELPEPGAVIIRRGDNLWSISRRTYGRGIRYTTIYKANQEQIRDPHWIYPGQVFMLPTGDRAWDRN